MAPRKSKRETDTVESVMSQSLTRRVTRSSSTAAAAAASASAPLASVPEQPPAKKKPKNSSIKEVKEEEVKVEAKPEEDDIKKQEEHDGTENNVSATKTVVIEHCKQCRCFKTRADQVKNGLESGVNGIKVVINPEKPRRGCFEVRQGGGEAFITILDLKRPFKKLKDLDMDEVISDIVNKIK